MKWNFLIYLKSPGAYEQLRNPGVLKLPHKKTLLKYANYTKPKCGINVDVVKHLVTKTKEYSNLQRVVILFDEMKSNQDWFTQNQPRVLLAFVTRET